MKAQAHADFAAQAVEFAKSRSILQRSRNILAHVNQPNYPQVVGLFNVKQAAWELAQAPKAQVLR